MSMINVGLYSKYDKEMLQLQTAKQPMAQGHLAQLVMCLTTDAYLTADPGVASSIPS